LSLFFFQGASHRFVADLAHHAELDQLVGYKLGALDYLIKSETTPASLSRGVQDWVKE